MKWIRWEIPHPEIISKDRFFSILTQILIGSRFFCDFYDIFFIFYSFTYEYLTVYSNSTYILWLFKKSWKKLAIFYLFSLFSSFRNQIFYCYKIVFVPGLIALKNDTVLFDSYGGLYFILFRFFCFVENKWVNKAEFYLKFS